MSGSASVVQRLVQRAGLFADLARGAGVLPALADVAEQVVAALRRRWPDVVAMPAYPALAGPDERVVHRPEWWVPAP